MGKIRGATMLDLDLDPVLLGSYVLYSDPASTWKKKGFGFKSGSEIRCRLD